MIDPSAADGGARPDQDDARARLARLREETTHCIAGLSASFTALVETARDNAPDDEHDPEGHTIAWERQQVAALMEESKARLEAIQAAQRRLDEGAYGTCTSCERRISVARLEALPATTTCIDCAT